MVMGFSSTDDHLSVLCEIDISIKVVIPIIVILQRFRNSRCNFIMLANTSNETLFDKYK